MFLSEEKKRLLTQRVLEAYNLQYSTKFTADEFECTFGLKNYESLCSVYFNTKRTDDSIQIKIYVMSFGTRTEFSQFKLEQMEDYGPSKYGQVQIATAKLDVSEFSDLQKFANSYNYNSVANIITDPEPEEDLISTDDGFDLVLEKEST